MNYDSDIFEAEARDGAFVAQLRDSGIIVVARDPEHELSLLAHCGSLRHGQTAEMTGQDQQAVTYRQRAADLRAEAAHANHPETKRALLSVADNYMQLAKMIEDHVNLPKPYISN